MKKEQLVSELGRPILRPIGILQVLFVLAFISSPFIWIWKDFTTASKVGVTGIAGAVILYFIYEFVKKVVGNAIDESVNDLLDKKPKGKFQERLKRLQEQRNS